MKIIAEWVRAKMISAQEMPPSQLVQSYRDSLKIEENPLSEIYFDEILERLYSAQRRFRPLPPTLEK